MPVIDIHTHMFGDAWRKMYLEHGGEGNTIGQRDDGREYLIPQSGEVLGPGARS